MNVNLRAALIMFAVLTAFSSATGVNRKVSAQPLVSGGLIVYYNFDQFSDTVLDGSGNGFNGRVQDANRKFLDGYTGRTQINTHGLISNVHSTSIRGGGAIRFLQSNLPGEDPVFVDMNGSEITATHPELVPTTAVSFAAWVNLSSYSIAPNSDTTIVNGSSIGHGVPHFQIQPDGKIRFTIRNEFSTDLVSTTGIGNVWPNQPAVNGGAAGTPWPLLQWHHVAVSYDHNANGGAGLMNMYYDGQKIFSSGNTGLGSVIGAWELHGINDFYDGLGLGCVYDSGERRMNGFMDELYIFNRALSAGEVNILAHPQLVPEPASGCLLLVALGAISSSLRYRRER